MHPVLYKSFGGLTKQYYFRQFFFGLLFAAFYTFMLTRGNHSVPVGFGLFLIVSTFLYPYSRFVYESVVEFIVGQNLFILPLVLMMIAKIITMAICFVFAIFIAPLGLAYLYFRNR
jgi:hypothetical protein